MADINSLKEKFAHIVNTINNNMSKLNERIAGFALKTEIPTKTSQLTNDSGFLTSAPSNMVTTNTDQTMNSIKTFRDYETDTTIMAGNINIVDIYGNNIEITPSKIQSNYSDIIFEILQDKKLCSKKDNNVYEILDENNYTNIIPKTSTNNLGLTKVDGDTIVADSNGVIKAGSKIPIVNEAYVGSMGSPVFVTEKNGKPTITPSDYSILPSRFDGQWNLNYIELSTTKTAGTYTLDLSNYLPNDEYTYEVEFKSRARQSSSASSACAVYYYDTYTQENKFKFIIAHAGTEDSSSIILPITPNLRSLKIELSANVTDHYTTAIGYRRIGTNS